MGRGKLGDGPRLALETGPELGGRVEERGEHLDGHVAVETGVPGPVDFSHSPRAKRGEDLIRSEQCSLGQLHGLLRKIFSSQFITCEVKLSSQYAQGEKAEKNIGQEGEDARAKTAHQAANKDRPANADDSRLLLPDRNILPGGVSLLEG